MADPAAQPNAAHGPVVRRRPRLRRGLGRLLTWLQVLIVLCAVGLAVAWKGFGYQPLVIQSGSMEPALSPGTMVFVAEPPAHEVRAGDVITFDPPGAQMRTTHRVHRVLKWKGQPHFVTKGDANDTIDVWKGGPAPPEGVDPELRYAIAYEGGTAYTMRASIPLVGWLAVPATHGWFRLALIVLPLTLVGVWLVGVIWRPAPSMPDPTPVPEATPRTGTAGDQAA